MQPRFEDHSAAVSPRRAGAARPGRIDSVEATSGGLLRATLGSAAVAGVVLTVFWLPAEYGIDATGLGRVLGLTQMGEIKQQLYAEDAAEAASLAVAAAPVPVPVATDPALDARLAAIEAQLAAIADVIGVAPVAPAAEAPAAPEPAAALWRDEVSYTLAPGEGIEVKLVMDAGAIAEFEWTANGSVVNYDTHGDGAGNRISYEQGRAVPEQAGTLTAAFAGNHGWFWRNRTEAPATVTLRVRGDYAELRAP